MKTFQQWKRIVKNEENDKWKRWKEILEWRHTDGINKWRKERAKIGLRAKLSVYECVLVREYPYEIEKRTNVWVIFTIMKSSVYCGQRTASSIERENEGIYNKQAHLIKRTMLTACSVHIILLFSSIDSSLFLT